jgi:CRISPR-associated endoribonuclease Cas6
MPCKFGVQLIIHSPLRVPRFTGHLTRAIFLKMVGSIDLKLAEELHRGDAPKPFSVTPLWFKSMGSEEDHLIVDPSHPCIFGVKVLDDRYIPPILSYVTTRNTVEVQGAELTIDSIRVKARTFEELLEEASPIESFIIRFQTPTYLSRWGVEFHEGFPQPVAVFSNLLKLWNTFAPIKFDRRTFRDWVDTSIAVSGFALRRPIKPIDIGRGRAVSGFRGWCAYRFFPHREFSEAMNHNHLKLLYALCRFGEFSNVGGNRTGGFGVIKFIPKINS